MHRVTQRSCLEVLHRSSWSTRSLPRKILSSLLLSFSQIISSVNVTESDYHTHTRTHTHAHTHVHTHAHTHRFSGPLSGTTQVSQYQKRKINLDFTEARDSECQCHQLGHMQVCTSLQTDNHASTPPLSFLQAGCPSCRPTSSIKALKAESDYHWRLIIT